MISYETYKMLHLFCIIIFFGSLGFVASDSEMIQSKTSKFIVGFVSFLIMVAGMGLIARLGYKHGEPFPLWIKLKIVNWLVINILLVFIFRLKDKQYKALISFLVILLGGFGIWVALNKPV